MRDRIGFMARVHPHRRRVAALPLALALAGVMGGGIAQAYSNSHFGTVKNPASRDGLITCILTSDGPMVDPPWTLVGKLAR